MAIVKITEEVSSLLEEYKEISPFKYGWHNTAASEIFPYDSYDEYFENDVKPLILSTFSVKTLRQAVKLTKRDIKRKEESIADWNKDVHNEVRDHSSSVWKSTMVDDFEKYVQDYQDALDQEIEVAENIDKAQEGVLEA